MALSSIAKNLSERLSYYANWKFNFQKTKVIESLRYLDEALERLVSAPFFVRPNRREFFLNDPFYNGGSHRWALFYEEAQFLNHIIEHWQFDMSRLSKYEQQDYNLAVEKLKTWKTVLKIMQDGEQFIGEIKRLQYIRRTSRWPQTLYTYNFPELEWDIVTRFHVVMQQLEQFPEWREKFKSEVEPQIKQLADMAPIPLSQIPFNVFYGIDLHSYFR
jgi:hypothetical protein